ncbi:tetratricopeptide repeat protein [Caulobacter sp. LARHSG274]
MNRLTIGAAAAVMILAASPCGAASFWGRAKAPPAPTIATSVESAANDALVADIDTALKEGRRVDATALLNRALLGGGSGDPRLMVLLGEANLSRNDYEGALAAFRQVPGDGASHWRARQGEGLALSILGRSDAAIAVLQEAVAKDPGLWRAWNGLGSEYDRRHDWTRAEAAYAQALQASDGDAWVLNNRGFSRLLQGRLDEAAADLVKALEKRPDLAAARGNLRLAIALQGEYGRAAAKGGGDDPAALLNNAGFGAILRGDYDKAIALLDQAGQARGAYYPLASENRKLALSLQTHAPAGAGDGN